MIDNRDNKKEKTQEKSFPKVHVNCLPYIYAVHRLNPYKIGFFSK